MVDEEKKPLLKTAREWLIKVDIFFHLVAAVFLLAGCGIVLYLAALNFLSPSYQSVIHLVNDVLLALIILELLWTVIRFLKKQKFLLSPFFAVGIIAVLRRILLIEVQTSTMEHVPEEKIIEMAVSAVVILLLMISYYISVKSQKLEGEQ